VSTTATDELRSRGYVDRVRFLVDEARGKRVLDCGVVAMTCSDSATRVEHMPNTLHFKLRDSAREVVGIDHAADVLGEIKKRHPDLDLRACDVERVGEALRDVEPFEVIVFGDILEHLSNPGRALSSVRRTLAPGGTILITCPNAFGLPNFARFVVGRYREGADHVAGYSKLTLNNLLERCGFRVERVYTALDHTPRSPAKRLLYTVLGRGLKAFPELGGTLVVVARRVDEAVTARNGSAGAA
jgi:SAM-dependent methyltransferase